MLTRIYPREDTYTQTHRRTHQRTHSAHCIHITPPPPPSTQIVYTARHTRKHVQVHTYRTHVTHIPTSHTPSRHIRITHPSSHCTQHRVCTHTHLQCFHVARRRTGTHAEQVSQALLQPNVRGRLEAWLLHAPCISASACLWENASM